MRCAFRYYIFLTCNLCLQAIYDEIYLPTYNLTMATLPILLYGIFEQNIRPKLLLSCPALYKWVWILLLRIFIATRLLESNFWPEHVSSTCLTMTFIERTDGTPFSTGTRSSGGFSSVLFFSISYSKSFAFFLSFLFFIFSNYYYLNSLHFLLPSPVHWGKLDILSFRSLSFIDNILLVRYLFQFRWRYFFWLAGTHFTPLWSHLLKLRKYKKGQLENWLWSTYLDLRMRENRLLKNKIRKR